MKELEQKAELIDDEENTADFRCTMTMISDRFALSAAHCFKEFKDKFKENRLRTMQIRTTKGAFEEIVPIRRFFTHSEFGTKLLHFDFAVIELGK